MSTYNDATVIIPQDPYIKSGKVYALKPTSGVGDSTFARASDGTRINSDYIMETSSVDFPRLDYSYSQCPDLLIEEESENLITYSDDLSNADWTKNGAVALHTESYRGLPTWEMTYDASASYFGVFQNMTLQIGYNTISAVVKAGSTSEFRLRFGGSLGKETTFDLTAKTITLTTMDSNTITELTDGYLLCTSTVLLVSSVSSSAAFYTTDGYIFIQSPQVELLECATSYIPTVASTVVREEDLCTNSGDASLLNDNEGCLYWEGKALGRGLTRYLSISDGTSNNYIQLRFQVATNQITYRMYSGGVAQGTELGTNAYDIYSTTKIAIYWSLGLFKLFVNGSLIQSQSGLTFPTGLARLDFTNYDGNGTPFFSRTASLLVLDVLKSDDELIALTTL